MSSNGKKALRSDLLLLGGGGLLLLGSCVIAAVALQGLLDQEGAPSSSGGSGYAEPDGREIRIPVGDSFSDTTASDEWGSNAVRERWITFGSYSGSRRDVALLRFPIGLSPDAEVSSAKIEFRSAAAAGGFAQVQAGLRIFLLDSGDQGPFATQRYPTYDDLATLPVSGTHVEWVTGPWQPDETRSTAPIAQLVRSFLRRPDYAPGKHIGIKITGDPESSPEGTASLFRACSFESGHPPVLVLRTN